MIYLDHAATSPLHPEVFEVMVPWLGTPANPSSVHRAGQAAAAAVEQAREQVAALLGANPAGVVFTSGATEANHTFLRGAVQRDPARRRVVVSPIEHPSVHGAAALLGQAGHPVERLDVGPDGVVILRDLPLDTAVLSLMAANHETGVFQPVDAALEAARSVGAALHVDATQAAGRTVLDLSAADGVVLSSHKLGGPMGVGALVLPDGKPFPPLLTGGSQERKRRAGTVNTPGVVGFGQACELAAAQLAQRTQRWRELNDRLRPALLALGARPVGDWSKVVASTSCVVFPGISGELLVQVLDLRGICLSSGAACASGSTEPSPVLTAMGDPEPGNGLRISLGPTTTAQEIETLLGVFAEVLPGLQAAR